MSEDKEPAEFIGDTAARVPPANSEARSANSAQSIEHFLPQNWGEAWPLLIWGFLAMAFALVFAEAIGALFENALLRAAVAFAAMVGLVAMVIHRSWLVSKFKNASGNSLVLAISTAVIVLALAPFIEQRRWPFSAPASLPNVATPVDSPTQSDFDALKSKLGKTEGERDAARQELEKARQATYPERMGAITSSEFTAQVEGLMANLVAENESILITGSGSPEDADFTSYIGNLFQAGRTSFYRHAASIPPILPTLIFPSPNYSVDLDAPKFPSSATDGIVIHGEGDIQSIIQQILSRCFVVKRTQKTVDGLAAYYKRKVIWIEVGSGPHWENSQRCAE